MTAMNECADLYVTMRTRPTPAVCVGLNPWFGGEMPIAVVTVEEARRAAERLLRVADMVERADARG